MALITNAVVKSDWLDITGTDKDALIDRLIAQVGSEIKGICSQPIEQETVTLEFGGESTNIYPTLFTVPVTLTTLQGRDSYGDSWTTITTTTSAFQKDGGQYYLYAEDGFAQYRYYKATMTVGFATIPDDVKLCAYEMVTELYLSTQAGSMQVSRFGISAVSESEGGVTVSKTLASMRVRAQARLSRYVRMLI